MIGLDMLIASMELHWAALLYCANAVPLLDLYFMLQKHFAAENKWTGYTYFKGLQKHK